MEWSIVAAVNDEQVLKSCLLRSPDLREGVDIVIEKGHASAAGAYNSGMEKAKADLVMFVHQDIYLPPGWLARVERAMEKLEKEDPNWGVAGVWGTTPSGDRKGYMYWTGITLPRGGLFEGGEEVETLDEVVLILRKSSGLRFDPKLPGYHMYGPDICLQARSLGRKSYAVAALCIHNTNTYVMFPWAFWKSFLFMRRKWRFQLPIQTSCIEITRWCWPAIKANLVRLTSLLRGRLKKINRADDPSAVYLQLGL